ncbi:MAG: beta-ketoacyl-ACP synthase III, partial [Opitutae bacterium]|nr:beta-ketoacyl-ACP synthase III [Opitutae bacterium]
MQQPIPSTSALILNELGSDTAGLTSFDINSTCLSFLVAWDMASCLIHMGRFDRLVIVSSEVASPGLNWREPESAGLIADGAAAVVVGRPSRATEGAEVHASLLKTYAERAHLVEIRGGG